MAIALNTVIVDGQEYKPGDTIPDFKSIKCVDTREPRKYQGLSADVSVLNDVIAKYASGGASCFMSDTGEYYEYDRKEKAFKLITNITERGFGSEKAYGALKHMLKNVSVSDEKIKSAVTDYLTVNPVLPGATTEQVQQIEQNKEDITSLKAETSSLEEDIDYIVFKDKIGELTFNSEGSSSAITLNGNTITSINATKEQYKAFINTSLFENGRKYIVVIKFKNNSNTDITVYANAFSYSYEDSIGKAQSLGIGKSETSVMSYIATSDIRGFSIYSLTENASYTSDIYVYEVTDKDISNIDFSVGGTKIKILKSDLEKPYFGKILCTYGDSITAQQTWQDYVQRELGFSRYYNHGVGGRRLMAMATDECLAEITEDFDVILVMGGTNDWAQDRTIGTENDINTDDQTFTGTFYGGLNALIKKLTTKYPTKRIVFMAQTPTKNSNGEKVGDYNYIKQVLGYE